MWIHVGRILPPPRLVSFRLPILASSNPRHGCNIFHFLVKSLPRLPARLFGLERSLLSKGFALQRGRSDRGGEKERTRPKGTQEKEIICVTLLRDAGIIKWAHRFHHNEETKEGAAGQSYFFLAYFSVRQRTVDDNELTFIHRGPDKTPWRHLGKMLMAIIMRWWSTENGRRPGNSRSHSAEGNLVIILEEMFPSHCTGGQENLVFCILCGINYERGFYSRSIVVDCLL